MQTDLPLRLDLDWTESIISDMMSVAEYEYVQYYGYVKDETVKNSILPPTKNLAARINVVRSFIKQC